MCYFATVCDDYSIKVVNIKKILNLEYSCIICIYIEKENIKSFTKNVVLMEKFLQRACMYVSMPVS